MQSEPNTAETPFHIDVAERVKRLPPYFRSVNFRLREAVELSGEDTFLAYSIKNNPTYKTDFIRKMSRKLRGRKRAIGQPFRFDRLRSVACRCAPPIRSLQWTICRMNWGSSPIGAPPIACTRQQSRKTGSNSGCVDIWLSRFYRCPPDSNEYCQGNPSL